jgi:hypothetical protein
MTVINNTLANLVERETKIMAKTTADLINLAVSVNVSFLSFSTELCSCYQLSK